MTVIVMDGADQQEKAEVPVSEAVSFIEEHSKFSIDVDYVTGSVWHDLTPYKQGIDYDGDGAGDETAYAMMGWNMPDQLLQSLPVSTSYLFLYSLYGNRPAQAGSALGLDFGLKIGGKARPYATVPTDQWWYINSPKDGFKNWAAQILTHEIINTIQAKVEAPPHNCGQLTATHGTRADKYEAERLSKITDACYDSLRDDTD